MDPETQHVWITTRRLKPGTREEFRKAWRPKQFPKGMLSAHEYWAEDRDEVVGISVWESPQARDEYRLSEVEAERRRAMAPYVVEEHSGFYDGRELVIPRDGS
jgi:heme-degrading monooxygenase HmoA